MIFWKKKKKEFNKIWVMVRLSEAGNDLNVDHRKISIMYGNNEIETYDYSEELLNQLKEKYPVIFNLKSDFEERPFDILISNRFELGRLGLWEE